MPKLTITISDTKYIEAKTAILKLFPNNETKPDPLWIDPKDGSEAPTIHAYTDDQWLKEIILRDIKNNIKRGKELIYRDNFQQVNPDEYIS